MTKHNSGNSVLLAKCSAVLAFCLFVGVLGATVMASAASAQSVERVDADVIEAVRADRLRTSGDGVEVFILFDTSQYELDAEMPVNEAASRVAQQRESFLATLSTTQFELTTQFTTVPAVSGVILSETAVERMAQNPDIVRVSLNNSGGGGNLGDAVPLVGGQASFDSGFTGSGVTVAVFDTGIDSDHPSLTHIDIVGEVCFLAGTEGTCPNGSAFQQGPGAAEEDNFHGTAVTGVLASNDTGPSSRGMAPGIDLVAVKVTDSFNRFATTDEVLAGLDHIYNNHPEVDVVNLSLGTDRTFGSICDDALSWTRAFAFAVDRLRARGVIVISSSGNNGLSSEMGVPGCIGSVWAVGSSTVSDEYLSYTNGGSELRLVAPGGSPLDGIRVPTTGGGVGNAYGTSFAAPLVAGCAALLFERGLSADEVEVRLLQSDVFVTNPANGLTYPRLSCDVEETPVAPPPPPGVFPTVTCLAGNGRLDINVVNSDTASHVYRLEVGTLGPRVRAVQPNMWWRSPVTGRPDGLIKVVLYRDNAVLFDRYLNVACDAAESVSVPEVQVINVCRGGLGFVAWQFANPTDSSRSYVISFDGVPNRSTTAGPYGAAVRGVSGRQDGTYDYTIRAAGVVVEESSVTVDCG